MVDPERQTVTQGSTATITCQVTGSPTPTVTWTRVGADLGPNHRVLGNVLRILQAVPADRGLYVCNVENLAGQTRASAIVEVEREC